MDWKNAPYHYVGLENTLERIEQKKQQLDNQRPLSSFALKSIRESLVLEWTYNSNSIEGNTLTLQETRLLIEEGITVKGKSMREHLETVNHDEAIEFIFGLMSKDYLLNAKDILKVHEIVLQLIEKEYAGRYRTSGVRITGANFIPPNALKVDGFMEELIDWVNESSLPVLVKAAIFHHRFVYIHPFFDGNGRTVRLVYNLLLMQNGYPPAIILKNDRKKYYDALNQANEGDYAKILLLVLQAAERTLDLFLAGVNDNYEDYQPISMIVQEPDIPYDHEYVSLLARKGKIDAFKEGRDWLTTKDAVIEYIQGRQRKRRLG